MAASDYTDQIEAIIVALLRFVRAFVATTSDVALHPRRFAQRLSGGQGHYLKPFSFLTVATFSSVTVTRYALIAVAIAVSGLFPDCSGQTLVPKEPPSVKELMQLPSVETLVYVALPVVLSIILTAKITDWILLRRAVHARRGASTIFLYVAGMQQIVVMPVLFGVYLAAIH